LFRTYYALKETPKGPKQAPPRLRCSIPESFKFDETAPEKTLEATVGLPVPETVISLPKSANSGPIKVKLADWEYGETAEILHIGSYAKEQPTIAKLLDYIKSQGFVPAGIHEEEYIIGPGMSGATPEKYYTIIRYPVVKAAK
jgi:effector-binding domain-containing protein